MVRRSVPGAAPGDRPADHSSARHPPGLPGGSGLRRSSSLLEMQMRTRLPIRVPARSTVGADDNFNFRSIQGVASRHARQGPNLLWANELHRPSSLRHDACANQGASSCPMPGVAAVRLSCGLRPAGAMSAESPIDQPNDTRARHPMALVPNAGPSHAGPEPNSLTHERLAGIARGPSASAYARVDLRPDPLLSPRLPSHEPLALSPADVPRLGVLPQGTCPASLARSAK